MNDWRGAMFQRGGVGREALRSSGAETEEAIVEALLDDLDDLDLGGVWMLWVEQVVPGSRRDDGGDKRKAGFQRSQPFIAHAPS